MTSRLSIAVTSTGSGAKATLVDQGIVATPGIPLGVSDVDPDLNVIEVGAVVGDAVGVEAFLNDLTVNANRYRITSQSTAGFFAVNASTGELSITAAATGLAGQTKTVTVESLDQVTGTAISETYSFTFTA